MGLQKALVANIDQLYAQSKLYFLVSVSVKLVPILAMSSLNSRRGDFFYKGRDDIEEKQSKYLNEERMAFVQNYLETAEDTSSLTTGTSDDGIGTHSAPSDSASEEKGGKNRSFLFAGHRLPNLLVDAISERGAICMPIINAKG